MPCIHATSPDWINHLRDNQISEAIFWKGGTNRFSLKFNDYFYFVATGAGNRRCYGRGRYKGYQNITPEVAWGSYGHLQMLGVSTEQEFYQMINDTLQAANLTNIKCILIGEIEWLNDDQLFEFDADIFARDVRGCKIEFLDEQIDRINFVFPNINHVNDIEIQELLNEGPTFIEGAEILVTHKRYERNTALIRRVKGSRDNVCEICNMSFPISYDVEYIEAHHKIQLSQAGMVANHENDIALLCANCHRVVHKKMAIDIDKGYEEIKYEIQGRLSGRIE
jgi:predicted HNH restriction endonuclease